MNPRSYEANSDEFPDLYPASRNLIISLQHLHTMLLKVSSSLRKPKSGFLDIGKQVVFECVLHTHSKE